MRTLAIVLCLVVPGPVLGQDRENLLGEEFVSTFSIVAYDAATGELGVGVQSRAFRAGAIVPWAVAGVGAIATQAAANQTYGPRAIELLKEGRTPEEVVRLMTEEDPGRDRRQVAVIDATGRVAAYTGSGLPAEPGRWASHLVGSHYSVQGNTLEGEQVVTEMARGFEEAEGELAERLMASLEAGQAAGGDLRGMQAAGIYIVRPIDGERTTDKWIDVRVDDAVDPFKELRRLMEMSLAARRAEHAQALMEQGDAGGALTALQEAVAMNPRRDSYLFTLAGWYADAGRDRDALNTLRAAIGMSDAWKEEAREADAFGRFRDLPEFQVLTRP